MFDEINPAPPLLLHVDLNSCFATIEQQSRPLLRDRPVAVVNRRTTKTAIITASYEAKRFGVKTGMKYADAKLLCPDLVALESDPPKYRWVYRRLKAILGEYSPEARMKSIDEGVVDLSVATAEVRARGAEVIGWEIKQRLKEEIGEYMRCNVGIGTNRFLAKTAAGMNKPDGLTMVDAGSLRAMYETLELKDLTGIAGGYSRRLWQVGITTPLEFLDADEATLERIVFRGKPGRDWYRRLRGWEVDTDEHALQTVGRQFVLDERELSHEEVLRRYHGLVEDVAAKLRAQSVWAHGVRVYAKTYHVGRWQQYVRVERAFHDEMTLFGLVRELTRELPLPAYEIGVSCYGLVGAPDEQLLLFGDEDKTEAMTGAIDAINTVYGAHMVHSADTTGLSGRMARKIPFGSVRYL